MTAPASILGALDPDSALRDLFGFPEFRPGQAEVVEAALAGEDTLAVMPTGAGKSLCYQLPAYMLPGCAVVISPLVALMKDQVDSLPDALRERAAVFNSTIDRDELDANMAALVGGRLKLVYVAPERLRQRPFLHALTQANISRVVIDEAHCISLWGHDFRPDYLFLPEVLRLLGDPPVLAMTATATPQFREELGVRLGRPLRLIHQGVLRPNLYLTVERAENKDAKFGRLMELCNELRGAGIIYVSSRKDAETLARFLRRNGVNARFYHAGLERADRAAVQDAFMGGRTRVIVATVAFGMGVDKADVRFIIHFSPSRSLEAYAQESGRAGRDGLPSTCTLFWATSDKIALSRWAKDDTLTPKLLNAVYRPVARVGRERADGFTLWPVERLVRAAAESGAVESDETSIRVALGALEGVGVLRRHCDLPESAAIRIRDAAHPVAARIAAGFALGPGNRVSLLDLADLLEVSPAEVEAVLLDAQDAGALEYSGYGRSLLLELLPRPADLAERLRALLDGHAAAQEMRADEMKAYAENTRICRAAVFARHFRTPHADRCGNCDACVSPSGSQSPRSTAREREPRQPASAPERAPEDLIIACIEALPFPMGRTGVAKVLKGSIQSTVQADRSPHFGALAALTLTAINDEIDRMVQRGYLYRDDGEFHLLSVTQEGDAKPPAPWPPLQPMRASRRVGRTDAPPPTIAESLADGPVGQRLAMLREWRGAVAREAGIAAYRVFDNKTLVLLAERRITSTDDLLAINGIGPVKLQQYGDALLDMLGE